MKRTVRLVAFVAGSGLLFPAGAQQTQAIPPRAPLMPPEQNAPAGRRLVQIPLQDCSSLLCVDMISGTGRALHLVLDLGERNAYLSLQAAKALGLDTHPLKDKDGGAIPDVQETTVPGAKLGDLPMGDFPFMVIDTGPDMSQQEPGKAVLGRSIPGDGTLTYGALQNRLVQLDIANHLLRVSEPQSDAVPCPHDCSDLITKHFGRFGPPTITADGFAVNGQPIDAQIDTLFTGTMIVYPAAIEKLGLKKQAKSKDKQVFPYLQNGIELARADGATQSYRNISLAQNGPLYFPLRNEPFTNMQFDATIGTALLSQGVTTFDFKGNHFWMEVAGASTP
ncbi:MAG: hypothetical protein JO033_05870 [Acidobacteriaceae bacterium]|nr:hypothetical protein [Acidobacteriaceae bacterium]